MKRIIGFIVFFLSICICFGQNIQSEKVVKRLKNKLYIVENECRDAGKQ